MKLKIPQQDKILTARFRLAFIICVVQLVILFSFWQRLPPQVPLFYSRPWGTNQLTSPLGLLTLPGLSVAIILINLLIGRFIDQKEILMKQIISTAALVFNLLCLITLVQIIRLVI